MSTTTRSLAGWASSRRGRSAVHLLCPFSDEKNSLRFNHWMKNSKFLKQHSYSCFSAQFYQISSISRALFFSTLHLKVIAAHGRRKGVAGRGQPPLDFEIWRFPTDFLVEKCFSPSFELVTWNLTTLDPLWKNHLATHWKIPLLPPLAKYFRRPCHCLNFQSMIFCIMHYLWCNRSLRFGSRDEKGANDTCLSKDVATNRFVDA